MGKLQCKAYREWEYMENVYNDDGTYKGQEKVMGLSNILVKLMFWFLMQLRQKLLLLMEKLSAALQSTRFILVKPAAMLLPA